MGVTEDRAYYLALAGLTYDNPRLTLQQLKAIADIPMAHRLLHPFFDDKGAFVSDYDGYLANSLLTSGEESVPRLLCSTPQQLATTQSLRLTYFTARKTELITQVKMITGGTAAGATPTLVRIGLYTVDTNGDLTLVANTANDTTLFAAGNTAYTKALAASYQKIAGQRYALGLLVVTGAAFPSLVCAMGGGTANDKFANAAPLLTGLVASQSDLPSSVANASVAASTIGPLYCELLP